MESMLTARIAVILLALPVVLGFSSTGVPCYLHPSADGCHYYQKPDSPACTGPKTRAKLEIGVRQLNRSLYSLEQQLIRLGVIPPDNACSELPHIANGGVVYTDLNLAPGCTGKYICNEGYDAHALYGQKEFNCTEDGIWNGNVTTAPVACVLMVDRCDPPNEISNGNLSFIDNDTENVLSGDMVRYACDDEYDLAGSETRFCLRTGNWSGDEPECIKRKQEPDPQAVTSQGMIAGVSVGSILLGVAIAVGIVVIVVVTIKRVKPAYRRRKESQVYSPSRPLIVSDEPSPSRRSHVTEYAVIAEGHTSEIAKAAAEVVKAKERSSSGDSTKSKSSKKPRKPPVKPKPKAERDFEESYM